MIKDIKEIQDSIGKREISGRVWTGEDMIYLHSLELEYQNMGMIMAGGVDRCETFMEYAGLKDKNEKKIFEGDLVRIDDGNVSYVRFCNGCFCAFLECMSEFEWRNYEVIGNVFEHPNLFKLLYKYDH
jgi:hypothetical protein